VTLLHRTPSALFPQAEHLVGDRNRDLGALLGAHREWDVVVDPSAYVPRQVREAAGLLRGRVGHYQLVSTISVYRDVGAHGVDESAPVATLADPTTETVDGQTYGALKALCERALREALPREGTVVRPGLLVGPFDPTHRFGWWLRRIQRGGDVLCPGTPHDPVQFIDARDAAAFMQRIAEQALGGAVFNLSGPVEPLTMGGWLDAARAALNPQAALHWVDAAFLLAERVAPWSDLPLWLPPEDAGLHRTDLRRAIAAGLRCRPLDQTLRDSAQWLATEPEPPPPPGLAPEREAQLLERWQRAAPR
jgi:2'-hydroxyisoflavone reductase